MRIILDLQACQASSMHRGISRYSMALALAMARNSASHDLRIILNQDYPDSVLAIRKAFDGLLPQSHISTFAMPVPAGEVDKRNAWRLQAAERIRAHYLASLRPDIVHIASLFEGLSDNVVASVPDDDDGATARRTAVTLYDLIPLMRKDRYLADPNQASWYYRKLEGLKRAGLLLAISESARSEALELLGSAPDSVVNISSAVDGMFRPRALPPGERAALLARHGLTREFIMYTGGIDYRKNIEGLIEAYSMLPAALRSRYQLAVVCKVTDPDRLRLQRLAARLNLEGGDLVLTGFVPDDDLISLYNSTSLFVFPSLHEGFGLPVLEAMACGAPVIGSNCSSIPEVIGRGDAMFDPADRQAICASMVAVLESPARQAELRAYGLERARRFSWDASAQRAIEAFEETVRRSPAQRAPMVTAGSPVACTPVRKPRMAFVSPLPPQRSGIADYSADLLPELARYYDIELILQDEAGAGGAFPHRSVAWFDAHAHEFDRIVYQFGNSEFHVHMFGLLERHPGVVVLHDFYLSGVIHHAEAAHPLPNNYCRTLYHAHGYPALAHEKAQGRVDSILAYPCNKNVLDRATGVIVHSAHAVALADQWYGNGFAAGWKVLPLPRTLPDAIDRAAARQALGLDSDDFVLCSFGILSMPKCNDKIVEAWIDSALASDPRCHLVFVGELAGGRFGMTLRDRIAAHPRIRITGYADLAAYRHYLAAADAAVQLRRNSRGETSASVLDCLSFGLPTIVNAHGSAAELPPDACLLLADDAGEDALRTAIERLHGDRALRDQLRSRALAYTRAHHTTAHAALRYREAIEMIEQDSPGRAEQRLIAALIATGGTAGAAVPKPDLLQTAGAIAANRPRRGLPQMLIDVGAAADSGAMLAPAPRAQLAALLARPPAGWRVEPVRPDGDHYRYARRLALDLIGRPDLQIEDAVVEARTGDAFVTIDGAPASLPVKWLARGVTAGVPGSVSVPQASGAPIGASDTQAAA